MHSQSENNSEDASSVSQILSDLKKSLQDSLNSLNSLGNKLDGTLHNDVQLPDVEALEKAAEAIDLSHRIQILLDPKGSILADHFLGYVKSKCLVAAVQQHVPDALRTGPATLDELATTTSSHRDRLGQVLRILSNQGIFKYDEITGQYSNNAASALLYSDHWTQWHNWVTLYGNQFYDIARGIPDAIKKDATRSAAQINYDTEDNMFSFFKAQGWVPQLHRTLGGAASAQMPGIIADYPWNEVSHDLVMDIGGGGGSFLANLLREYPTMTGGIFDLPHVITHTRPFFRPGGQYADIGDRVSDADIIEGDFFKSVPRCSVYTMKWCLHDWKDSQALEILKTIRSHIVPSPNSRLLVLESILADGHSGRLSQYGDINMMMTINGQERTEKQWYALAGQSGWKIERIYSLRRAWVKALDFRPIGRDAQ